MGKSYTEIENIPPKKKCCIALIPELQDALTADGSLWIWVACTGQSWLCTANEAAFLLWFRRWFGWPCNPTARLKLGAYTERRRESVGDSPRTAAIAKNKQNILAGLRGHALELHSALWMNQLEWVVEVGGVVGDIFKVIFNQWFYANTQKCHVSLLQVTEMY